MEKNVEINESLCTGCGACINMCPAGILKYDGNTGKAVVTDHMQCDRIGSCMYICPTGAIKVKMQSRMRNYFGFNF